jgi:hypothetical protein
MGKEVCVASGGRRGGEKGRECCEEVGVSCRSEEGFVGGNGSPVYVGLLIFCF